MVRQEGKALRNPAGTAAQSHLEMAAEPQKNEGGNAMKVLFLLCNNKGAAGESVSQYNSDEAACFSQAKAITLLIFHVRCHKQIFQPSKGNQLPHHINADILTSI